MYPPTRAALPGGDPNAQLLWDYRAGVDGTPQIPAGWRVRMITAVAIDTDGSFTINGGDSIPVPADVGLTVKPDGFLISPTITFTGTVAYFVEIVGSY